MASANSTSSAINIAPPTEAVIVLAYADIVCSAIVFILSGILIWKHGKIGMMCWPIFNSAPIARLVAAIYLLVHKDDPMLPTAVSTMTSAAVLTTISLTLIGVVYECNIILPSPPKTKTPKIMLVLTHLFFTLSIIVTNYAGTPSATGTGGVINEKLNQIGSLLMLSVLFAVCGWMWPTYQKIRHYQNTTHPNADPARRMFLAGVIAMPLWLGRVGYIALYAFHHDVATLDPVMGSFAVKLIVLFGLWLVASIVLIIGGWNGVQKMDASTALLLEDDTKSLNNMEMGVRH